MIYDVCWVIKTLLKEVDEEVREGGVRIDQSEVVSGEVEGRT